MCPAVQRLARAIRIGPCPDRNADHLTCRYGVAKGSPGSPATILLSQLHQQVLSAPQSQVRCKLHVQLAGLTALTGRHSWHAEEVAASFGVRYESRGICGAAMSACIDVLNGATCQCVQCVAAPALDAASRPALLFNLYAETLTLDAAVYDIMLMLLCCAAVAALADAADCRVPHAAWASPRRRPCCALTQP